MNYKLKDLIDMEHFQKMQDRLNEIYSFPSAIIDNDGNILTATGWQDICTQFHRKNKDCERDCIKSDQYIMSHLHEAKPIVSYRCRHGLVDNAIPIVIDGIHYGNFFTGQFFMEEPDMEFFRAQAKKYGFNEDSYLEAVKKVPIWTQEQLNSYLFFITGLISIITESGLKRLKEIETRKQIEETQEQHRIILLTAMDGFWMVNTRGHLLEVNEAYCRMSGYSEKELLAMNISDLEAVETNLDTADHIHKIKVKGEERFESVHRRKDGSIFDVEVSAQFQPTNDKRIVVFLRDITDRKRAEGELKRSKEFTETVLNSMTDAISIIDVNDFRIIDTNRAFYELYGLKKEDILGKHCYEISHNRTEPCAQPDDICPLQEVLRTGRISIIEHKHFLKNGKIQYVEVSASPIKDENGNIASIVHVARDISGRKLSEKALKESEIRFRSIVQAANDAIIVGDGKGNIILWNKGACEIFGYEEAEILGMPANQIMPERYRKHHKNTLGHVHSTGKSDFFGKTVESVGRRKDGSEFPLEISLATWNIEKENYYSVIIRDISERKRIEKEREDALIKAQNEKYKTDAIIAALPDGIIIQDINYIITYQSPIQSEMYGEHAGEHCYKVYEGRDTVCEDCPVERTFMDGKVHRSERSVLVNGKISYFELTSSPLKNSSGKIIAGIKLVRDITERKLSEEKIKASLKEKEILLKEIHHRSKNNMQIISSLLGLASGTITEKKYVDMFRESQNRINSMSLIHENLYHSSDLAKIELNEYVRDLANRLFQSHGVAGRFELILDIENVSLGIDLAIPCGLILNELITNSLKYAFPGDRNGEIKVSSFRNDENMITIIFSDNGVGIPSNIDFRNTQSLGLHLVTMLAEGQLHGKIDLDRSRGSEFKITFKEVK